MSEATTADTKALKKTRKLLKKFKKKGVVYWTAMGDPKENLVLQQMLLHALHAGCRVLRISSDKVEWVLTSHPEGSLVSGDYVMIGG